MTADLRNVISTIVSGIHENEQNKKLIAEKLSSLREQKLNLYKLPEENLCYKVNPAELNCKIAGIDSGFCEKNIAGFDITFVRAAGVVFSYSKNVLCKADYWPSLYQFPTPLISQGALEKDEANCSRSLLRLQKELEAAKAIIELQKPDYCFIDGSIVPQYADKPRKDSRVKTLYEKTLYDFQELYSIAEENSCILIACVEDSRGSRLLKILQDQIIPNVNSMAKLKLADMHDVALLDYILNVGERSFAFPYSEDVLQHPILMDYDKKWANKIYAFYIKPCLYDKPLRVEFICDEKSNLTEFANKVGSVVYALSSMHREYAYPTILIEADLRARLNAEEVNIVFNKIIDKLGKNIKIKLRRQNRPF